MFERSVSSRGPDRFLQEEVWKIVIVELWLRAWFEGSDARDGVQAPAKDLLR
jgi:hypothetical protein